MLNLLFEFDILAATGSFTEAAEILNLSQSALSKHIMKLEAKLGLKLVKRTPYGITVTPEGEKILKCIPEFRSAYNHIHEVIKSITKTSTKALSVVSLPFASQYEITKLLGLYQSMHPDIELSYAEREFSPKEFLNDISLDFFFAYEFEEAKDQFTFVPFFKDYMVIVMPVNHPLASRKSVTIEDLKDERFIFSERHQVIRSLLQQLWNNAGIKPNCQVMNSIHFDSLLNIIEYTGCVTLMMRQFVQHHYGDNVAFVDLEPYIDRTVYLVYKKNAQLSSCAKAFINLVKIFYAEKKHSIVHNTSS